MFMAVLGPLTVCISVRAVQAIEPDQWTEPVPLTEINSSYHDKAPFLSFDGLTLYFSRENEYTTIYQAIRPEPSGLFTMVEQISTLNYPGHVSYAWVSPDNLRMYYYRTEWSARLLKFTERASINEPWQPGIDISELNILGGVANPSLTPDELTIVFTGLDLLGGQGGYDIWMATRPDKNSPFSNVTNLTEVNSSAWDFHPSVSPDGLTLYFSSRRNGNSQLFRATRESLDVPFGPAEHLHFLDSPGSYLEYPFLSSDGTAFYFAKRTDEEPFDIYVSYFPEIPKPKMYYVDAVLGNDLNNGLSPEIAFATIQKGIDTAEDGDTVMVYPGIYTEEIKFKSKAITVQSAADAAVLQNPSNFAVSFYYGEGPDSILKNFVITNSLMGIFIANSSPTIGNLTVVDNKIGVMAAWAEPDISNCIFWNNTDGDLLGCQARYSCIEQGGEGEGNIDVDPLFVDSYNGDYHLCSSRGRYWPEYDIWVMDKVTSPCVDGGDPTVDPSGEPLPNGGRINMGAYGGTAYASMSEWLPAGDINHDGVVNMIDFMLLADNRLQTTWSE